MHCETCEDCNRASMNEEIAWYRWKTANLGLIGCKKHLKEVIETLNAIQQATMGGVIK
jgi:hypothetical protein